MVQIYDISGKQPVLGEIEPAEVQDAIVGGGFSLPKGVQVNVVSPDGTPGTISAEEAPEAFKNGYKYHIPGSENLEGPGQAIKAGVLGFTSGVLGPVAPLLEQELKVGPNEQMFKPEEMRQLAEAHPLASGIGQTLGLGASMLTGGGEGALIAKAGEQAKQLSMLGGEGAGLLSKIGGSAVSGGAEMALLQSGDEFSKLIQQEPGQTTDTAMANIGLSSLLGGAVGAGFGALSPLWKVAQESKLARFVEDFKSQLKTRLANPNPAEALSDELGTYYKNINDVSDEIYGPKGLKNQEIKQLVPEMNDKITEQTQKLSNSLNAGLTELSEAGDPHLRKMQNVIQKWEEKVTGNDITSHDVFSANEDLKRQLQEWAKFERRGPVAIADRDFISKSKDLAREIRLNLEDSSVWGKAGQRQQAINKAFSEFLPSLKDFNKKFTAEVAGEKVIDPGKVNTYVNQLGKPNAELKQEMLNNFLDSAEKYKKVIEESHKNLDLSSPFEPASLNHSMTSLEKQTLGAQIANTLVNKGLAKLGGESLGSGIGAGVGALIGHPWLGALLGEHTLGPIITSVLPGIVKPILEKAANAQGFKSALNLGMAAFKSDALLAKGAKAIFKSGTNVSLMSDQKDEKQISKLKKRIDQFNERPEYYANIGGQTGHYLPEHQANMSATAVRSVNYLNSLKPKEDKMGILDEPREPSKMETARYEKALRIAENPLHLLNDIKDGTITHEDVIDLRSMYPGLYQRMSGKILNEMNDSVSKENKIPYKTKIGLSLFLGQPLDGTMTPQSISMNQPIAPQQPQSQQMPNKGTVAGTKNLKGLITSIQTPDQARAAHRLAKA